MDSKKVTTLLIYLAAIIEKADEQVLPSVYYFAGKAWGATPSQLGSITLCRALVQALASPLSGFYGDRFNRTVVIAWGCLIWGIMTSAIAESRTIYQAMIFAAANGLGLSLVIPCSQSLIADLYAATFRGRAFGIMQLISAFGVVGGGLFATNIGGTSPFGLDGWRFALHLVAIISILTGLFVWYYAEDPRKTHLFQFQKLHEHEEVEERHIWKDLLHIVRIPSFQIIILQGVIGSLPWNAMVFFTLWFQLLEFSDFISSLLLSVFHVGCALGGVIGGIVADGLATKFPDYGRVITAQISCSFGFPLFFVLFKILPRFFTGQAFLFAAVLFLLGCTISWCGSCCNAPMFSELVPQSLYSNIFAFDRSFEGAIASTAAPLVGYAAQNWFGFHGSIGEDQVNRTANATALGNSLFVCITVPLFICCVCYTGLYWTFPKDRRKPKSMGTDKQSF